MIRWVHCADGGGSGTPSCSASRWTGSWRRRSGVRGRNPARSLRPARAHIERQEEDLSRRILRYELDPDSMPDVGASADYGGNGAVMATRGEDAPSTWAIDAWSPRADEFALDQAGGGVTDRADTERISVQYANGERDVRAERFMFFDHNPDIRPGSVVYAPAKPQEDEGIDWGTVVSRTVSVVSTAATVMLAISRF